MRKCRKATIKEILIFQHKYCETAESRDKLVRYFMVTVEAYEELPPWYSTFNADGSDIRLKDGVIMLRVCDLTNYIEYYPVFSEAEGLRLLSKWEMEVPPKMTAFAHHIKVKPSIDNASLRSLIAFSRWFMLRPCKHHPKMAYGFNNLYKQLHDVPSCGVCAETVKLINEVVGEYLASSEHCVDWKNLQEFAAHITSFYSLLDFCDSDFTKLREKLRKAYPSEKINF